MKAWRKETTGRREREKQRKEKNNNNKTKLNEIKIVRNPDLGQF